MATKLAKLISDIVKRSGVNADEKKSIKAVLENSALSEIELDDADALAILTNIHSKESAKSAFSTEFVEQGRGEAYNAIKAKIEDSFAGLLEESDLEGVKATKYATERVEKLAEVIKKKLKDGIKGAKKDGDDDTVVRLNAELAKLNADMKKLREDSEAEKNTMTSKHREELFQRDLIGSVSRRNDILTEKLNGRHFAQNFLADLNEFQEKKGIKIDAEKGVLLKKDGTPYFTETNEKWELNNLVDAVIEEYEYKKKSGGEGGGEKFRETVDDDNNEMTEAERRNLQRINRK
jgi:hypothetical protein